MVKIMINGRTVEAQDGSTILAAAEQAGIAVPHFCYHPGLLPEGTCRMCAVEIEGAAKLEPSCATVVREGMKVLTESPRISEARRNVLEFLLADHPIDCPICDKAGECGLQDYYQAYGLFPSAFREGKTRRLKLLKIGNHLLLDRERCVLCTRCVRFVRDVSKTGELGVFERGGRSEIGIFEGNPVASGYAGNLVDICPVGAITDATFRFRTRTWLLEPKPSICPFCARGCRVYVDVHPGFARKPETGGPFRVRPREDATAAGPWICDEGRYGWMEIESRRRRTIVWNKGPSEAVLSRDKFFELLSAKFRALSESGRTDRLTIVLHSGLTVEEWIEVRALTDYFQKRPVLRLADPPNQAADGFLRTAERTPNRRGAVDSGLSLQPLRPEDLAAGGDLLIVFAGIRGDAGFWESHGAEAGLFRTRVLVSPTITPADGMFDFVLPGATPYEKSGSYLNIDGARQEFEAVRDPGPDIVSEGDFLRALTSGLRSPIPDGEGNA